MKIGLICTSFLILFSCKNATVDLESISISSNAALIELSDGKQISQNQNPSFTLAYYFEDRLVSRLAIYDASSCDEAMKVGEISNQIGSSMTSGMLLAEGNHDFYYKPVSDSAELNVTALCSPTGLNYVIDRTAPNILGLTLVSAVTAGLTADRNLGLSVNGCENTMTGASSLIFKEQITPSPPSTPIPTDVNWQDCSSSKVFTVSEVLGPKNIYVFSKDEAGNVSSASTGVSVTLTTSPIIVAPANPLVTYSNDSKNLPFAFSNVGGRITDCIVSPSLPAGLTLTAITDAMTNTSNCEIIGLPSLVSANSSYQITAVGVAGAVSSTVSVNIEVKALPLAVIIFNEAAGPANPHLTFLNANVGGSDVIAYKYFVSYSPSFDCGSVLPENYTTEASVLSPIFKNLFINSEGSRTLCVKGKNADNVWQQVATGVSWNQAPMLQRLVEDFATIPKIITMHDRELIDDSISRPFLVGGSISRIISCDFMYPNCKVDKNINGAWLSSQTFSPGDKVRIKINGINTNDSEELVRFIVSGIADPFTFKIRTMAPSCGATAKKRIFLSKNTYSGALGSGTIRDQLCNQEATDAGLNPTANWKVLVSTSVVDGLSTLGTFVSTSPNYCDAFGDRPILSGTIGSSYGFVNPFTNLISNPLASRILANGGGDEWRYIINVPRYLSATEFWYGSSACNCNDWTSETASTCSDIGRLTYESSVNNPFRHIPGNRAGSSLIPDFCNKRRHLICYEQ